MRTQPVWLGPFRRLNGERTTDRALQGTFLRGGFNFEVRDGEWWSRKGEECEFARVGSTPWWWMFDVNRDVSVICNPWYALKIERTGFSGLYAAAVSESVNFTNGSKTATPATTRTVGQLMLVGTQPTTEVYRVTAATGAPSITLDRAYEGTNGAKTVKFYDIISETLAGAKASHDDTARVIGNACVFEQLVTHAANELSTSSPATTAGHLYLIITTDQGAPAAIDLSDSTKSVLRNWFALTNKGPSTLDKIGSDTLADGITPRGVYSVVYKNRLFIGAASDPNDNYGSRTLYYSANGDFINWHSGNVSDMTATPNFKTFDGEGNTICAVATLADDLIIHRDDSQEICTATQSAATPFVFRSNNEGVGLRDFRRSNRIISARGKHFIWTRRGPYVFDGRNMTPICEDVRGSLRWQRFLQVRETLRHVQHDDQNGHIYWFSARDDSRWDEYANPTSADYTTVDGGTMQNYYGVFVYDYESDNYWYEDRPASIGGGLLTITKAVPAQLYVSRTDGTIIILNGRSKGKDACLSTYNGSGVVQNDPADITDDVAVTCVAETPWLDFGSPNVKRMTRIETQERSLAGEGPADFFTDSSLAGLRLLRIQVYGDMNADVLLSDITTLYDSTDSTVASQLATHNVSQAPTFIREFTPRVDARQFKLIISNTESVGAIYLSAKVAPVRLSDILVELQPGDSLQPKTTVNEFSYSGV